MLAFNEFRHHVVIVGVKPFGISAAAAGSPVGARPRPIRNRCRYLPNRLCSDDVAEHYPAETGGQNMIVPGKIAHRQQVDPACFC